MESDSDSSARSENSAAQTQKPVLHRQDALRSAPHRQYRKCFPNYTIAIPTLLAICIILAMITYFYIISQKKMPNTDVENKNLQGSKNKSTKVPANINPVCLQPIQAGNCRAKIAMIAFSADEWRCVRFLYSGCRGNKNRFEATAKCEEMCY